nr:hypothetical protein [Tanacetum cinerariifolium]
MGTAIRGVQGELLSFATNARVKSRISMHQTQEEFVAISDHAADPLSVILYLEPKNLAHPANVLALKDIGVSPLVEWINAMVDVPNNGEPKAVFVQGIFNIVDGYVGLALDGLGHVFSGLSDVVVSLSIGGKDVVPSFLQVLVKRSIFHRGRARVEIEFTWSSGLVSVELEAQISLMMVEFSSCLLADSAINLDSDSSIVSLRELYSKSENRSKGDLDSSRLSILKSLLGD